MTMPLQKAIARKVADGATFLSALTMLALVGMISLWLVMPVMAENPDNDNLPAAINAQAGVPLAKVGSGTYRKFGFSVYRASLWAPGGSWDAAKPYALRLSYARSLSRDTLVDGVMDGIREQKTASEAMLVRWTQSMNQTLPAVSDGDEIIGLALPGKDSLLFYNGKQIMRIEDSDLSAAFFRVWLGEQADESLRDKLLGRDQ
ncbi:MAG: chalcone isomerase family protein [Alphaproteobacteria bacterium]